MVATLVRVTGKVQGVFFRASTREIAVSLGLVGYAKNLPDGSVELMLSGSEQAIDHLLRWLKTEGPPLAQIGDLSIRAVEPRYFDGFQVC